MDKLTSILALVDPSPTGQAVRDKATALARQCEARVDLVSTDPRRSNESAEILLVRRALERRPDLVIKPLAGAHPLRRWTLEPSDRWLAAQCPVPLLLAGDRPWGEPLRMAAAVDVADLDSARFARAILQSAGFLALGCHARLDVLYSEREAFDERLRMERAVKLAQLVREFHIAGERMQRFDGAPESTLPAIISARQYDLLVIGAVTHRPGIGSWFETLSSKLASATAGDLLLVKPGERAARGETAVQPSARQQRTNLAEQLL